MTAGNRFLQRIAANIDEVPERCFAQILLDGSWHPMTRADLAGRMGAFVQAWQAAGVGRGDVVFIILRHGVDAMPAFLAAMWIGAVPSFLPHPTPRQDPALYRETHAVVLRRSNAKALLAEPDLAASFRGMIEADAAIAILSAPPADGRAPLPRPAPVGEDDAALLQHSSGTTGLKKGVVLTYRAIAEQLEAYAPTLGLDARSCIATWLPLYHDMGLVACFLLPAMSGIPIVAMDPFEWVSRPQLLFEAIEAHRATHAWLPNFAFAHLLRGVPADPRYDLSGIVALTGTSEPNRPETFDRFHARFRDWGLHPGALQTSYGMAEAVFAVCQSRIGEAPRRLGIRIEDGQVLPGDKILLSNGRILPGVAMAVLQDGIMRHDERLVGELCIASPFNFSGYLGDAPDAVRDRFHRSGDIGFLDGGEVFVLGRINDLIIVNGRNLYAHDIEAAVSGVPGIRPGRCVALGVESARTGSQEIVIVAEAEDRAPALAAAANRAVVAHFGLPAAAVELVPPGWLRKTTSGKVSRADNLAKYLDEFGPRPGAAS